MTRLPIRLVRVRDLKIRFLFGNKFTFAGGPVPNTIMNLLLVPPPPSTFCRFVVSEVLWWGGVLKNTIYMCSRRLLMKLMNHGINPVPGTTSLPVYVMDKC